MGGRRKPTAFSFYRTQVRSIDIKAQKEYNYEYEEGNPTYYLGHILTWEKGRQLKSFGGNTYTYNANGIRTSKTVDSVRHDFVLDGAKILRETWGNNTLTPLYDNEDSVCGIIYNNVPYYFQKNLQGDIIGIVDKDSTVVARYSYDAWGKCTIDSTTTNVTIANINPFRYRSYYFDSGINLYYLQSRYYDPEISRFINGDEVIDIDLILGSNLFAYCTNDPTVFIDMFGYGRTYVIYYNNEETGFYEHAINSPYYNANKKNVYMLGALKNKDFIKAWNSMSGEIDYVYLYLHGSKGALCFKGESLTFSGETSFKNLKSKTVKKAIYLLSCYGGAGKEGENVAWMFAKLADTKVYACTGGISYDIYKGKYIARKSFRDFGLIKTFFYAKKYIFWGKKVPKSYRGTLE